MERSIIARSKLDPEWRLDAEFYRPTHLVAEGKVKAKPHTYIGRIATLISGPFGSTVTTDRYVDRKEFRYIRGKDVRGYVIDEEDPVYVGSDFAASLPQYHLKQLDVLTTVVGMNFGKASVVSMDDLPAIFSCKSSLLRDLSLNPWYVVAFLTSKYGYALIRRGRRGAAQPGINLIDIRKVPIPVFSDELTKRIVQTCELARDTLRRAKGLAREANNQLLEEIGLRDWTADIRTTFSGQYLSVRAAQRLDAEYFQPHYLELFKRIGPSIRLQKLGALALLKKGIEVGGEAYAEAGIPFWRVSNVTRHGLDDEGLVYINPQTYDGLKDEFGVKTGDLLLTKDATPGVATYVDEARSGIVSNGILRLQGREVNPYYLELVLNSVLVQAQISRSAGGSVIKHWKPSQVRSTLIARLGDAKEAELAAANKSAHDIRRKGLGLFQRAALAIEMAIDHPNEIPAIAELNS